ncbi:hypothetical protein PRZ48_007486 [Zasmidium cellare]|uniref:Sucrose transporter n=1 Tax=Zasmidium cellare TaxID=395010 RepID=A0ABR0EJG7_ZASCE|nr:hypothetical protein PRZ48_007486 [Zasmidium cellare]
MTTTTNTGASSWTGQPRIKGNSEFMRLFLLTLSLIGLQFCWGTEQTYATPYLLKLGLSKGKMSLVWIAGPLSGLIMQPIIGMISDKSSSKYGRRRPFMVGGTVAVAVCLIILGWAEDIVGWFVEEGERRRHTTVMLAVVDIYILDFVINIAQATCRALVVDALPVSQQQLGAAWVARMIGIGHMLVFGFGALDLNTVLPSALFGDTQFKKVCSIAAMVMVVTQFTTCWAVTERVLVSDGSKLTGTDQSLWSTVKQIYERAIYLPERIQAICSIQFWSWIGWFPMMFYGSTWVGEIYLRNAAPNASADALTEVGRIGSTGLIIHSTVGFTTAIVLPWLVTSPGEEEQPGYTPRPPERLKSVVNIAKGTKKPSLLNVWTAGCAMFAAFMIWAPLVQSVGFAIFLMAITGVPSAIAGLSVGTFIGVEVQKLGSYLPVSQHTRNASSNHRFSNDIELDNNAPTTLHVRHSSADSVGSSSTGELSGIYLGILNIYTTLPQFVGTAISWVVFSILEPGKSPELAQDAHPDEHHSTEGVSGIGVCLFIGALSSIVAARATRRLREDR